jgi:predicted O-methyltransferase YrrM
MEETNTNAGILERVNSQFKAGGLKGCYYVTRNYMVSQTVSLYQLAVLKLATPKLVSKLNKAPSNDDIKDQMDFIYKFNFLGVDCKPFQKPHEISKLLKIVKERKVKNVLEIGTDRGGTLFLYTKVAEPNANIISINLPWSKLNAKCMRYRRMIYENFASDNQHLHQLNASSHDDNTLAEIKKILGDEKLDFLFIDGDHSYEGVKQDFEMYSPLVRKGGIIAFHDVALTLKDLPSPGNEYWEDLKKEYGSKCESIIDGVNGGIGVLYW